MQAIECKCGQAVESERAELGLETCKGCASDAAMFGVPMYDSEGCIVGMGIVSDRKQFVAAKAIVELAEPASETEEEPACAHEHAA